MKLKKNIKSKKILLRKREKEYPENYDLAKIEDLFKITRGKVISSNYILENKGIYPVYSSASSGDGSIGKINTFNLEGKKLTWTTDGFYAGSVFFREGKYNCTNVCGVLELKEKGCEKYFSYLLKPILPKYVTKTDNRKLMSGTVSKIPFIYNNKVVEQEKIAQVLSQQEEQVNNIQKLIEKLEKRNQYYAERLLSGELRVREDEDGNIEFYENKDWKEIVNQKNSIKIPNGWDIKKLKDIGFVKTSSVNKVINDSEILVGLVNYMDVYRSKTKKIFNNLNYSETSCKSGQITENNLQKGDVLITPSSETREDIGHSTVVMEDFFNKVYSYHLVRFRFNEQSKIILDFKPYLFNSKYLRNQFERYAQGVTRMTLKKDSIERCFVKIPTKKEQLLISNFLNTIFKEKNEFELLLEKEQKRFEWLSDALLSGEYQIVD